jgi:hypothetical protein
MATTVVRSAALTDILYGDLMKVTWGSLVNGDAGVAVACGEYADRSVQVTGTFGAGGTVLIEGTLDGSNWLTLTDPQGNALSFTAAKIEAVSEMTELIRPRVSAGDGTTAIAVTLIGRKGHQ